MQLEKHGLMMITPEVCVTALSPDGRALSLYQDENKSAQEISAFSQKDGPKYPEFQQSLGKISKVIGDALATTPPNIDNPSSGDLWSMLKTGRAIRKLGKKDMFRLLRWGPMAVADLASEYFETELVAGSDCRAWRLWDISRAVVGGKRAGAVNSRGGGRASGGLGKFGCWRNRRGDAGNGRCGEGRRRRDSHWLRSD